MLTARIVGTIDRDLALWLDDVDPGLRTVLEKAGLVEPLEAPQPVGATLSEFPTHVVCRNLGSRACP